MGSELWDNIKFGSMSIRIHSSENRKTINWAGGTSTEMFIYPSDGNFLDRNFIFRISSATVEVEHSDFTFFEGITRHLMILKGELELIHVNRYTKVLSVYEQDTFSGEWETKSIGKVTDFNLMLKSGAEGSLKHVGLNQGELKKLELNGKRNFAYVAKGLFDCNGTTAQAGDLIEFDTTETTIAEFLCEEDGDLIWIEVNHD